MRYKSIFLLALIATVFHVQFVHSDRDTDQRSVGMFNVYFSVDEALGYVDVRDDFAEVYDAGCNLVTHYFRSEDSKDVHGHKFWAGLDRWLWRNPEQAMQLRNWKKTYGSSLGWMLFFWTTYIKEAYTQTNGGLKVLVGEMYGMFGAHKNWKNLIAFVKVISEFEKEECPDAIAGWYIAEEPNSPRKRYSPKVVNQVIAKIRSAETEAKIKHHKIYIDLSANKREKKVASFLKNVDVVMISPDAYIWAVLSPKDENGACYENIHHAVRRMREYTISADNLNAQIHIVLQAYDWHKSAPLRPNNIDMHQQVRYSLQHGLVNRGMYGRNLRWVKPPDGLWFWWWHDCKFKKIKADGSIKTINRWDKGTEGSWAEAIKSELANKENAVIIHGNKKWAGTVHIIGDVIIAENGVLTIEPGTTVKFSVRDHSRSGKDTRRCELIVRGKLIAKGKPKKIIFTSDSMNKKQLARPRLPREKDWYGIRKEGKKAKVELETCQINYAIFKN